MITSVKNQKEIAHDMRTLVQAWSEGSFYGVPCSTSRISNGSMELLFDTTGKPGFASMYYIWFYVAIYRVITSKNYHCNRYSMRKDDANSELMPAITYHFGSCNNIIIHDNIIPSVYNLRLRHDNNISVCYVSILGSSYRELI